MKLVIIGFGVVGQGLARILRDKGDELRAKYGLDAHIVGVVTRSRGVLVQPNGLDAGALLQAIEQGHLDHYPRQADLFRNWDALRVIRESEADVMVEASPTNLESGQPALDYCYAALGSGMHIITANKGPLVVAYGDLMAEARRVGRRVLYEGTIMAGTPALRMGLEALAGCAVRAARGIFNGTTNYILTRMESGMDYDDALRQAQQLGYAESDPTADVEGWDAAAKVSILSLALYGTPLKLSEMAVSGITAITADDIAAATAAGERWKLIASVTPDGGRVQAARLPLSDPLAAVSGAANAITFVTDLLGEVTLVGPGAGPVETGFALLADLLALHRDLVGKT